MRVKSTQNRYQLLQTHPSTHSLNAPIHPLTMMPFWVLGGSGCLLLNVKGTFIGMSGCLFLNPPIHPFLKSTHPSRTHELHPLTMMPFLKSTHPPIPLAHPSTLVSVRVMIVERMNV